MSNFIKILLLLIGISVIGIVVFLYNKPASNEKNSNGKKIIYEEAVDLMKDDHILIDVRTKEEFEERHIKGAINIPVDSINTVDYPKDKKIIVYCRSGNRSSMAASELINMGYTNVYDLGAISDWEGDFE